MIKKFNAVEYLVEKYVEGEYAVIPMKLKKPEDFFYSLDPTQTTLAPEISDYIDYCAYNIPIRFKIRLKIICETSFSEEMKNKMRNAVKHHYGLIVYDKGLDLGTNTRKTIWLLLLGVFFLALVYAKSLNTGLPDFFAEGQTILKEVLLVTGWFFVWEAVENFVSDRRNLRIDKINNKQMLNSELVFENEMIEKEIDTKETAEQERIEETLVGRGD